MRSECSTSANLNYEFASTSVMPVLVSVEPHESHTSSSVEVDPDHLDELIQALNRLRDNNGKMTTNAVWSGAQNNLSGKESDEKRVILEQFFDRARCSVKRVDGFQSILRTLLLSSEKKRQNIMQVFDNDTASGSGVMKLSDETLCRVLELSVKKGVDPDLLVHVCRRFKRLVVGRPVLWTNVFYTPDWRKVLRHLTLSERSGLYINYLLEDNEEHDYYRQDPDELDRSEEGFAYFFNRIILHCERWREFNFTFFDNELPDWEEKFREMRDLSNRAAYFQRLHKISLCFPDPSKAHWGYTGQGIDFYAKWHTPRLRIFTAYNVFPVRTLMVSLTTCRISLVTKDAVAWPIDDLLYFLGVSKQLVNLTLEFRNARNLTEVKTLPRFEFKCLESFTLSARGEMETPNLKSMSTTLDFVPTDSPVEHWIESCIFPKSTFSKFERLDLTLKSPGQHEKLFHSIFKKLPHLRFLRYNPKLKNYPPLRVLRLEGCDEIGMPFVRELIEGMRKSEWRFDLFQKLEVLGCAKVEQAALQGLLGPEKVLWDSVASVEILPDEGSDEGSDVSVKDERLDE
ncbi:hypothetical protein DFH11DRAFT_1568129 [Phellopilus nigrolimitatus]|nr:hypothetical protein DFH11DRAFT_1568129 [Phellopilus nigrolimitatus]